MVEAVHFRVSINHLCHLLVTATLHIFIEFFFNYSIQEPQSLTGIIRKRVASFVRAYIIHDSWIIPFGLIHSSTTDNKQLLDDAFNAYNTILFEVHSRIDNTRIFIDTIQCWT
uniref:Uncharacterized protein n=1 Tax=Acrobeloides nanus TaxID=290746 RepID=A0A914CSF5_9BILA